MKKTKVTRTCMDAALNYLALRMRSETEMRRYLARKEYEEEKIDETIARLIELNLINDEAFATEMVRSQTATKPIGRRALDYKMARAGVDKQSREEGLAQYSREDEQSACDRLIENLINRHGTDLKGLTKVQRAALNRGFSYDLIRNAVEKYKGLYE